MNNLTFHHALVPLLFSFICSFAFVQADQHGKGSDHLLYTGDRVALVGGGLIERARLNGYLESALSVGAGPKITGLTFRNLGWSGDTVFNDARAYFGKPNEGRDRLRKIISEWEPTVVMLNYGAEVALSLGRPWTDEVLASKRSAGDWDQSVAVFLEGYAKMVEEIRKAAGGNLREIVVIAPPPLENLGIPMPDHQATNRRLAKLRDSLMRFSKEKKVRFVDLFGAMNGDNFITKIPSQPITHDGLHFTENGYRKLAFQIAVSLGYEVFQSDALTEDLRKKIIEKNRLFFHRWRPANETYLFLFRKHEQGNNAKEIPQFDPIIEEREKEIEVLRSQLLKDLQG
ncbi:MAG: GDSL-type esterase/lipase family protein [Opitutales bacterium]|nr:GDSL-type esterase/lipase family protein [Opitutales bacterium]